MVREMRDHLDQVVLEVMQDHQVKVELLGPQALLEIMDRLDPKDKEGKPV